MPFGMRNAANNTDSQLFYSYSTDAGVTWSPNVAVTNAFNPSQGYPNQDKIGDYITIVSDNTGGNVAYSATFNFNPNRNQHEEDVYYVRVSRWTGAEPNANCYSERYCNSDRNSNCYSANPPTPRPSQHQGRGPLRRQGRSCRRGR